MPATLETQVLTASVDQAVSAETLALQVMPETLVRPAIQETQEQTDQPELAARAGQQAHQETQETQASKAVLAGAAVVELHKARVVLVPQGLRVVLLPAAAGAPAVRHHQLQKAALVTPAHQGLQAIQETLGQPAMLGRLETLERQASPAMLDRQVLLVMQELVQPPVVLVVLHLTHGLVPPGRQELLVTQEPLATRELELPQVAQAETLLLTGLVKTAL